MESYATKTFRETDQQIKKLTAKTPLSSRLLLRNMTNEQFYNTSVPSYNLQPLNNLELNGNCQA